MECDACIMCDRHEKGIMDAILLRFDVTMAVMKALCVTECDACIMCDRCDKSSMYGKCNVIMMRCDNGCHESSMCDGM
jgi:hypothetical protein